MIKINKNIVLALLAFVGFACEPDLEDKLIKASSGDADFTRYISVGNSLTAGYADGGLYAEAQAQSFPAILSQDVFAIAGGGSFVQPTTTQNGIEGYLFLEALPSTISRTTPDAFAPAAGAPFNNLGVPGIRVLDTDAPGYGDPALGNPYLARILLGSGLSTSTTTYNALLGTSNPTFFTCWLGNNDVLGYATGGGVQEGTGSPAGTYLGAITPVSVFRDKYNETLDVLTANGAKGLVVNIPSVTDIPYFTTAANSLRGAGVPLDSIMLTAAQAGGLNAIYAANGYTWEGEPFVAGKNTFAVVSQDKRVRKLDPVNDLVLLPILQIAAQFNPAVGTLGTANTTTFEATPIPDNLILDVAEQGRAQVAIANYNSIIRAAAESRVGVEMWNANAFFADFVKNGYSDDLVGSLRANFISGGAFSLDGVHATPRGYALVAQQIKETIEEKFGAVLPDVNLDDYRGVALPQ